MKNKPFDSEEAARIIMDIHTLTGMTANKAQRAGVNQKKIDEIFKLSASMTATLLATLNISEDVLNKVLTQKLKEMKESVDTSNGGANNDATA